MSQPREEHEDTSQLNVMISWIELWNHKKGQQGKTEICRTYGFINYNAYLFIKL